MASLSEEFPPRIYGSSGAVEQTLDSRGNCQIEGKDDAARNGDVESWVQHRLEYLILDASGVHVDAVPAFLCFPKPGFGAASPQVAFQNGKGKGDFIAGSVFCPSTFLWHEA